jgi:hypothetical protein
VGSKASLVAITVACVVTVSAVASGCAWSGAGVAHYVGPVFFRHAEPLTARSQVSQILRIGAAIEAGTQWSVIAGVAERIAVAPVLATAAPSESPSWRSVLSMPMRGGWRLSPIYLRVTIVPALVHRATWGFEAAAGTELTGLSLGLTKRTVIRPPGDALGIVQFAPGRPLETIFTIWPSSAGLPLPDPAQVEAAGHVNLKESH